MSAWVTAETFGGDRSYESPVLTFDGAVTIYLNPEDAEGAALTLRVAGNLRSSAAVDLTTAEALELAEWLTRAVNEVSGAPEDDAGAGGA